MSNFSALKTAIQNAIKQNGNEEITGNLLQNILLSIVETLGDSAINTLETDLSNEATTRGDADNQLNNLITGIKNNIDNGYVYAGIATPSTTPVSGKVFYIALQAGTYTNFGNTAVTHGINILKYNGSTWSKDIVIGVDPRPKKGSTNLVESGGVFDNMGALDISELNATENPHTLATYADLSAALAAIPSNDYKKGGMSIKFVQTDDNKYVQFRLMSTSFSTTESDWRGVDEEPIGNSINVTESGGVLNSLVKNTPAFASIIKFPKVDLCKLYGVRELKVYAPNHLKDDEFCLNWLRVENTTLYFRIQDNTHSSNPTRTVTKTYTTIPTSGVEKIVWDNYSNTDFDVELVIDWSIFTGGINLSINNTHIIKVYPYSDIDKDFVGITQNNENKNIGITVWNDTKFALSEGEYTNQLLYKTIKSFPNSDIPFLYGVRKMEIYVPEHLKNDEFCLAWLYIDTINNKLCFRVIDNTNGTHPVCDAYKTYTTIPTSGIEEIEWTNYSRTNFDVKLIIDWSVFTGGLNILRNDTHIVNVHPYSDLRTEQSIELSRTTLSLSSFDDKYVRLFKAIRRLDVYTPYSDHTYKVRFIGYNSSNQFVFGIWDMTNTSLNCYATKTYTTRPTSGIEEIVFDYYSNTNFYYFKLVIDWSLYNSEDYYSLTRETSDIDVIPQPFDSWDGVVFGNNTDCACLLKRAKILSGTFTLDAVVSLNQNQLITGNKCVVNCTNNAKINMSENTHIDNIRFVGNWEQRTETNGRVIPIITMQNLEDEDTDAIFGEDVGVHNSLIEIIGTSSMNTIIENCIFEKFNKLVITVAGNGHDKGQPLVQGNYFNSCRCAICVRGGFERIQSNEFWGCCVGIFRESGNCNLVGNTIVGCDCAMYINNANGNGAHSICTGMELAHCGLCGPYYKEIAVNTGENWSGCLIGDADIIAEVANNLMFVGCYISTKVRIASGQKNSFVANNVHKVDSNPIYVVPADTLFANNRGINQTTDNEANNI